MTAAAALIYVSGIALAFGVRTWLQVQRVSLHPGPAGSASLCAGVSFVLALSWDWPPRWLPWLGPLAQGPTSRTPSRWPGSD